MVGSLPAGLTSVAGLLGAVPGAQFPVVGLLLSNLNAGHLSSVTGLLNGVGAPTLLVVSQVLAMA